MFQMEAFYADPNELPFGIASQISSFMVRIASNNQE
jgi:heat shock protein 4